MNDTSDVWDNSKSGVLALKEGYALNKKFEVIKDAYDVEQPDDSFSENLVKEFSKAVSDGKIKQPEDTELKDIRQEIFSYDKRGMPIGIEVSKIAKILTNKYYFITTGEEKKTIWRYYAGQYIPDGNNFIGQIVQEWTRGNCLTNNKVNEIIGQIQRDTHHDRTVLDAPTHKICLRNGILNIHTKELSDFDPKQIFIQKIDISYNPEAKCPKIQKFLAETISPEYIPVIQEFLGFMLYRKYFIKKSIILVGERDTGKTTLINLIVRFIGQENISGESLHRIITDKFSSINLYGKLVNIYDDLSFKDINDTGAFKIICGGGYITGEKKFGDRISFMNYAKLIFATNKISAIKDNDDMAYYDRWIPIPFEHQVQISEKDYNLLDKITTEPELEGLLIWAIDGLQRLLISKHFSDIRTAEDIKNFMERYSDSVSCFCQEAIEQADGQWISKDELYKVYSEFTQSRKISRVTKEKFGRDILSKLSYVHEGQKEHNGKKGVTGWLNIGLNKTLNTISQVIIYDDITDKPNLNLQDVSNNKVFKVLNNTDLPTLENLYGMLLDKDFMAKADLVSKGFTDEQISKWIMEGLIFESKAGYISLMR